MKMLSSKTQSQVWCKASQNQSLRLGPASFGSKLMDLDGLKVSNFQLKIWA